MTIKPTGYPPLPHTHVFSQVEGLQERFNDMRLEQNGASNRTYAPFCKAVFGGTFSVANNVDTFMGSGMASVHDNASMIRLAGDAGGGGDSTKFRIIIPLAGFYRVSWKYYMDGLGTSVPSASVLLNNNTSVTAGSIINAQGAANGWASPHCDEVVYLTTNDRLYFTVWQNSGASRTFHGSWFGGSRSSASAQWIGR